MSIKVSKYLKDGLLWDGITGYVLHHKERYNVSFENDVRDLIVQNARQILTKKESNTFVKFIDRIRNQRNIPKRETIYRLIFSLRLNELPEKEGEKAANELLQTYLQQNELSPKAINEFILIFCLWLNLTWTDYVELRKRYKERADKIRPASLKLVVGQTIDLYERMLNADVKSKEDLIALLDKEDFWPYFAKTRNTQYLALFDNAQWSVFREIRSEEDCDDADAVLDAVLQKINDDVMAYDSIEEYYLDLFSFDIGSASLSKDEIEKLADRNIFPNVFYTLDTFTSIVRREREFDVEAGTYLIRLLNELGPDDKRNPYDEYKQYVNFQDYDETINTINKYMINAGYGEISKNDPFGCFFIDVYKEILEKKNKQIENSNVPIEESNPEIGQLYSSGIKKLLFRRMIKYLREIISLVPEKEEAAVKEKNQKSEAE